MLLGSRLTAIAFFLFSPSIQPVTPFSTATSNNNNNNNKLPNDLWSIEGARKFVKENKVVVPPPVTHATLEPLSLQIKDGDDDDDDDDNGKRRKNILVIGDVHGCYKEMVDLHQKAMKEYNDGMEFTNVVLAGDLVNKGPSSIKVVRHARKQGWLAVRGNHDVNALRAWLGDETKRNKAKYLWVKNKNANNEEDILWLMQVPYSLRIPSETLKEEASKSNHQDEENMNLKDDVVVVHAGLVPGIALEKQTANTMIQIRNVRQSKDGHKFFLSLSSKARSTGWAKLYKGPPFVIFGHDAKRGLQAQHPW
eukprot:CAMPEP_0118709776 /NCGR_PEP_ID=MMETSP0800-20121206/22893_1 /TAXON_ID=210618 ORGANISM="Striatella unipunctata, Strain CCMP2910" /NCGR_SAMPLE_ID=MMETSP0800 /ASSEMBLY_ACC=CAM_ASM_000638 /LENGTH=307 /DNA_ID=CAMNT_0006613643 /DNA_START=197 /DNA_END=1117 /DNA_ORIENTATION=+